MDDKIAKLKNKIEMLIELAKENYMGEWTHSHELRLARIDGMIEALSILTNQEYYIDEIGLHEKIQNETR